MEFSLNCNWYLFLVLLQIGMRNFHLRKNKDFCPVLNLDKLWTLVSEQARLKYASAPDNKVPVINIVKAVSSFSVSIALLTLYYLVVFLFLLFWWQHKFLKEVSQQFDLWRYVRYTRLTRAAATVYNSQPVVSESEYKWNELMPHPSAVAPSVSRLTHSFFVSGLLQVTRQGQSSQAACDSEGKVLLKICREENQGCRRRLCIVCVI